MQKIPKLRKANQEILDFIKKHIYTHGRIWMQDLIQIVADKKGLSKFGCGHNNYKTILAVIEGTKFAHYEFFGRRKYLVLSTSNYVAKKYPVEWGKCKNVQRPDIEFTATYTISDDVIVEINRQNEMYNQHPAKRIATNSLYGQQSVGRTNRENHEIIKITEDTGVDYLGNLIAACETVIASDLIDASYKIATMKFALEQYKATR